jgi:asparagine synthase (glutamine-hydrolysing)
MCGVAGIVARTPQRELVRLAGDLTERLRHRGPDDVGFWVKGTSGAGPRAEATGDEPAWIVLGHRRLSIVDLAAGHQPMRNEDGSIWVTFNGEIYNHEALRRYLEQRGHRFETRSDTEVLVHGWEEWHEQLFGKLNGIFALALFDSRREELVLARDPLGVKPLYVGSNGESTWWASELGAAVGAGLAGARLSIDGLKLFFTFRFIPSPMSVFDDVWKVPPSHFVRVQRNAAGTAPMFQPFTCEMRSSAEPRGRREWERALMEGLSEAVQRQLMADVPVASLLSGGIDSTLISQLMCRLLPYAPHTYGIGFPSDGPLNEARAAERSAEQLGTYHHSLLIENADFLAAWPGMFSSVGEPIANPGGLLIQLLCEAVAEDHKVVLTGQGADEPLGGYPRHTVERMYPWARYGARWIPLVARFLVGTDASSRLGRALSESNRIDRYINTLAVLPGWQVDQLVPEGETSAAELARHTVKRWVSPEEPADTLNELLRLDARLSLADDLLLIADHFSMRASVELRVPFLDLEFIELMERMPSRYKISLMGARKWLYRKSAVGELPNPLRGPLVGRRARFGRKHGFNAPVTSWFTTGGPIGTGGEWRNDLARSNVVSMLEAGRIVAEADDSQNVRKRVTLYALSQWLAYGPTAEVDVRASQRC